MSQLPPPPPQPYPYPQPSAPPPPAPPAHPYGGWPPQAPYAPPARQRKSSGGCGVVLVLGMVVLLVGGGAFAYFWLGVGAGPEQVVSDYFAASQRGDCDASLDLVTEQSWRQSGASSRDDAVRACESAIAQFGSGPAATLTGTQLLSDNGDTAVVAATLSIDLPAELGTGGPTTQTVEYTLRKESLRWRLDLTTGPGLGTDLPELSSPELSSPGELGGPGGAGLPDGPGAGGGGTEPAQVVPHPGADYLPSEIVAFFYDALTRGDCSTMAALSTNRFWHRDPSQLRPLALDHDPTAVDAACREYLDAGQLRTDVTQWYVAWANEGEGVPFASVIVGRSFEGSDEITVDFELNRADTSSPWLITSAYQTFCSPDLVECRLDLDQPQFG